jgi:hypothetical protein
MDESSLRKVKETKKINIGMIEAPKYINIGTSCTFEEIKDYTLLFKDF